MACGQAKWLTNCWIPPARHSCVLVHARVTLISTCRPSWIDLQAKQGRFDWVKPVLFWHFPLDLALTGPDPIHDYRIGPVWHIPSNRALTGPNPVLDRVNAYKSSSLTRVSYDLIQIRRPDPTRLNIILFYKNNIYFKK